MIHSSNFQGSYGRLAVFASYLLFSCPPTKIPAQEELQARRILVHYIGSWHSQLGHSFRVNCLVLFFFFFTNNDNIIFYSYTNLYYKRRMEPNDALQEAKKYADERSAMTHSLNFLIAGYEGQNQPTTQKGILSPFLMVNKLIELSS